MSRLIGIIKDARTLDRIHVFMCSLGFDGYILMPRINNEIGILSVDLPLDSAAEAIDETIKAIAARKAGD